MPQPEETEPEECKAEFDDETKKLGAGLVINEADGPHGHMANGGTGGPGRGGVGRNASKGVVVLTQSGVGRPPRIQASAQHSES